MADDIVTRLRDMATDHGLHRTHYEGCDQYHMACAALRVCDEIERLRHELHGRAAHRADPVSRMRAKMRTLPRYRGRRG